MESIELSPGCQRWAQGNPTKHPPVDRLFLEAVVEAGFVAFTHPGGLCGGQSEHRAVLVIHRGHGARWEVVFQEDVADVVTTTTTDLERMTMTILTWLRGGSLAADEDSVHAEHKTQHPLFPTDAESLAVVPRSSRPRKPLDR